jgi:WD40 repeat protein/tRNA A-37 threonylcarbamoyl transferase component Bud32
MMLTTGTVLQNRYRIVSLLGQGGMGAVYRAWDMRLNISVAVKEMVPQPGIDPQTLAQLRQQFYQEAQVLARLDHPNLVRVTDYFEEWGNAYLVMNFVEGQSLADLIAARGPLPEAQVLDWARQLLDALAYCHAQGVVHRDIKPQNIIIRADGRPILVDFGLVKLWDPRDPRTRTVVRAMGTPEYAPPEQWGMGHTDPRSDLYSLGATLYHALTGKVPPIATDRIAEPRVFAPPRSINPYLRPETERAILQAMELAKDARWSSAAEMVAALGAPAAGPTPALNQPISVQNIARLKQLQLVYLGAVVNQVAFSPDGHLLAVASSLGLHLYNAEKLAKVRFISTVAWLNSVAFSPDGRLLAFASDDCMVKIWDVTTGQERRTLSGHTARVLSVAFSPDSCLIASASDDCMVKIWDMATGKERRTIRGHTFGMSSVAFSPDGRLLASASADGTVKIWNVVTSQELRALCGHTASVRSVAFSPDSCLIASGSWDNTVKIWDVERGQEQHTLSGHTHELNSVAFSPDGHLLASASWDGTVKIWDVATGQELHTLTEHAAAVLSVTFSPDGRFLASASRDGTVLLWEVR